MKHSKNFFNTTAVSIVSIISLVKIYGKSNVGLCLAIQQLCDSFDKRNIDEIISALDAVIYKIDTNVSSYDNETIERIHLHVDVIRHAKASIYKPRTIRVNSDGSIYDSHTLGLNRE